MSSFKRFRLVCLIFLGLCGSARIDFLELCQSERRFLRIGVHVTRSVIPEINKLRLSLLHLCYDETHLKAPVTQMDIAGHIIAACPCKSLYALAALRRCPT